MSLKKAFGLGLVARLDETGQLAIGRNDRQEPPGVARQILGAQRLALPFPAIEVTGQEAHQIAVTLLGLDHEVDGKRQAGQGRPRP